MSNLELILQLVVSALLTKLPPEAIKEFIDKGLEAVETMVKDSKTQIDDITVLPVIDVLRKALNVPDTHHNNG